MPKCYPFTDPSKGNYLNGVGARTPAEVAIISSKLAVSQYSFNRPQLTAQQNTAVDVFYRVYLYVYLS